MKDKRPIYAEDLKQLRADYIRGRIRFNSEADMIDACPTVNLEDLRPKGKWVSISDKPYMIYECSLCNDRWSYGAVIQMNYGPNCGAKMEG